MKIESLTEEETSMILKLREENIPKYIKGSIPVTREVLDKLIKNGEDVTKVDTSQITVMSRLFFENKTFNQDISNWDTSNVEDMNSMFYGARSFNQPLSNWDVSQVTDMSWLFYGASSFNQDISNWKIDSLEYYDDIFYNCPIEEQYKPEKLRK